MPRLSIRSKIILLLVSVPAIVVLVMLAVLFTLNSQNQQLLNGLLSGELKAQSEQSIQQIAQSQGTIANQQLTTIYANTMLAGEITQGILTHPDAFGRYWEPGDYTFNDQGVYGTFTQKGDSSNLYAPNTKPLTPAMTSLITTSEFLDLPYRAVFHANPDASYVYINTPDTINRGYPFSAIDGLPPDMDVRAFNFFYLADAEHNPQKTPVWTPPYVDPLGRGWVITCATPVYSDTTLLGVTAIDMELTKLIAQTAAFSIPNTSAFAFIMDANGTLVAAPDNQHNALGLQPFPTPEKIIGDEKLLDSLNLFQSSNQNLAGVAKEIATTSDTSGARSVQSNGQEYILAFQRVATTGWTYAIMVPAADTTRAVRNIGASLDEQERTTTITMVVLSIILLVLVALVGLYFAQQMIRPISLLDQAAQAAARGELSGNLPVTTRDELGRLVGNFNVMSRRLQASYLAAQQANSALEAQVAERTAALEEQRAALAHTLTELQESTDTLRRMSTPIIPVFQGVVVLPIIGNLDEQRGEQIMKDLLHAVEHEKARMVLFDVTGAGMLDVHAAQIMVSAAVAAQLLGAHTILVGLRPEAAETLVSLGADLSALTPSATLQSGLLLALSRLGRKVAQL